MTAGGWALLGFVLLAGGELSRELAATVFVRRLVFIAATCALLIALAKHTGLLP